MTILTPVSDWWSRYQKNKEEFGIEIGSNGFDKVLMGTEKKMLAKLYNYLLEYDRVEEVVKNQMTAWAKNIGHSINLNDWETIWNKNFKLTRAVTYKENQYKMLYR